MSVLVIVTYFSNPMWGLRDSRNRLEHDKTTPYRTVAGAKRAIKNYTGEVWDGKEKHVSSSAKLAEIQIVKNVFY